MGKTKFFTIFIAFLSMNSFAQKCNFVLSGVVKESSTGEVAPDTYVFIEELSKGMSTNEKGEFLFSNLCKGDYHIDIAHVGCESQHLFVQLKNSKKLEIALEHYVQMLDGVHLKGHKSEVTTQSIQNIKTKSIQQNTNQNLGTLLESLAGVTTIKNGSGISKPVVHGMFGNRIMILNNGVVQSGQQWGNDHSPEIDPWVANNIKVIKGVGALEYQGSSLGSMVLVNPKNIGKDPHLHGVANSFFETNGNGYGLNFSLEKANNDKIDWRVLGTLKKFGDRKTANYYLNNTGANEQNIALQLRKKWSDKWLTKLYASSFNTELGILRGAHIATARDLYTAFTQKEPFYTESDFSYKIEAPKQEVHHHLLKITTKYTKSKTSFYEFEYAGQLNIRKEFDRRRSGRSNTPTMNLFQNTQHFSLKHTKDNKDNIIFKKGLQYTLTDNTNDSDTGILPLIPDYLSHQLGGFTTFTYKKRRWFYEIGGRYNFTYQNIAAIDNSSREVIKYENKFHNVSLASGIRYRTRKDLHLAFNLGWASRNPAINELYSNGLHQGVATFEKGDVELKKEHSLKTTLGLEGQVAQKWFFETLAYYQYINDYIFLNPKNYAEQTIRGSFRVSEYEQSDAEIYGLDIGTTYLINHDVKLGLKYSYLRGNNLSENSPLINMPANNLKINLDYHIGKIGKFRNTNLGVDYKYFWKQNHFNSEQDAIDLSNSEGVTETVIFWPPPAYQLFGLKMETQRKFKKTKWFLYVKATNLLNTTYRDYLNRLRYFADENGRSFLVGTRVKF